MGSSDPLFTVPNGHQITMTGHTPTVIRVTCSCGHTAYWSRGGSVAGVQLLLDRLHTRMTPPNQPPGEVHHGQPAT